MNEEPFIDAKIGHVRMFGSVPEITNCMGSIIISLFSIYGAKIGEKILHDCLDMASEADKFDVRSISEKEVKRLKESIAEEQT